MRIWDYRLISVLPNAQLKAMRYEIGDMIKQYPNIKNRLVSYANNYDIEYLFNYFIKVLDEFKRRNLNHSIAYDNEITKIVVTKSPHPILNFQNLIYPEHNDRYLKQCYYNLQEKFDRKIISTEEWQKITDKFYYNDEEYYSLIKFCGKELKDEI